MKKLAVTLLLMVGAVCTLQAQNTMKDLFAGNTKLTYLGLDFTQARFVGSTGFNDPIAIRANIMPVWNTLQITEYEKYSLQKSFKLPNELYAINVDDNVKRNKDINVNERIIDESYMITEDDVKKAVKDYNVKEKSGIGLSYVVECYDKIRERAFVWVTFIDLSNNKVLHTERVEGAAGGFGVRNYWLSTNIKIKKQVEDKLYKKWREAFK